MVSRNKVALVVVLMLLVVVGGYYAYWNARDTYLMKAHVQNKQEGVAPGLKLPAELTNQFDPSENIGIYEVVSVDRENERVTLRYIWPSVKLGQEITPVLTCKDLRTKIFSADSSVPRYVRVEGLLKMMETTPLNRLVFSGKCADSECKEISRDCLLQETLEKYGN